MSARPTGLLLLLFRLPIFLFRARLGWLFGGRLLLLVTRGRKSGLPRRVVIEVAKSDRASDRYWVVAGFGRSSDWYRNALASPPLCVDTGFRRFAPAVHELDLTEREALLRDYQSRYPRLAGSLGKRVLGGEFSDEPRAIEELAKRLGALLIEPIRS